MWLPMRHAPRSSVFLNSREYSGPVPNFLWTNHGAGKKERIRTGIREGVILTILIDIPLALMLLCIPEFLFFMLNVMCRLFLTQEIFWRLQASVCFLWDGCLCSATGVRAWQYVVLMLSGVLERSLRVVMEKPLTPYLAFRGVALQKYCRIGAWIMLMITYWIYQERTDSFR